MNQLSDGAQLKIAEIKRNYIASVPLVLEELRALVEGGLSSVARRRVEQISHRLVGSTGTFGLNKLAQACRLFEEAAKLDCSTAKLMPLVAEMEKAFKEDIDA